MKDLLDIARSVSVMGMVMLAFAPTADGQDDAPGKLWIEKTDGSSVHLPYLRFDIAAGTAVFAAENGGELEVAATSMTFDSLGKIAMRAPPVAAWLPPDKAYLCVPAVGALDRQHEEEAAQAILSAARAAGSVKEQIALLQLHQIVHGLFKADHDREEMEDPTNPLSIPCQRELARKEYNGQIYYANRHAINPLTGRDQKTPIVKSATATLEMRLRLQVDREQASRREIMLRLATCNIFARYCEISGRAAYAKELDELRAKLAARKQLTRDSEAFGVAIVAWMASRVAVHHHNGNNAALLKGVFSKLHSDLKVDQSVPIIFHGRPPEEAFKLKAALVAVTAERLAPSHVGDRNLEMRLRNTLRETIPELNQRNEAIGQLMPFIEEAIRMGSR